MEIEKQVLFDNFRCPICWEIVEEPWETSCCGNLFCEKCMLSYVANKCPMCRKKNFKYRKNEFAKLLLKEYEGTFECPYGCNKKIKLNEFKDHKYECEEAIFKCTINKCNFEGKRKNALDHLITSHEDVISLLSENYDEIKGVLHKFDYVDHLIKKIQNKELDKEINKEPKDNNRKEEEKEINEKKDVKVENNNK